MAVFRPHGVQDLAGDDGGVAFRAEDGVDGGMVAEKGGQHLPDGQQAVVGLQDGFNAAVRVKT